MAENYKTLYQCRQAEIVEKKSRFITDLHYVESEEEALDFIEKIKKQYWDARHHCWAFILGKRQEILRCSDDGEPQGTAGRPMLDVLQGAGLCDCVAVVTRYFGGTLLGTGGLVRAYSGAVQEGIAASKVIERIYGQEMEIATDYNGVGKIQYLLAQKQIPIMDAQYTENVIMKIVLPVDRVEAVSTELTNATSGKAMMSLGDHIYYAIDEGNLLLGEDLIYEKRPDH